MDPYTDPDTGELTPMGRAVISLFNLCACLNLIDMTIRAEDSPALPGWEERLQEIIAWADDQAAQLIEFGAAYETDDEASG